MATDPRSTFAAEVARIARSRRGLDRVEAVTKNGYTVLLTGMRGGRVEALVITDPDGLQIGRADGWKLDRTAEVAGLLWTEMEKDKASAVERERLAGLMSVSITSADATGRAASKETRKYHLTSEQLAQVCSLAESLATNAAVGAAE